MNTITNVGERSMAKAPGWFWAAGALGLVWNVYGVYQFIGSLSQTEQSLMDAGMTSEQAAVYVALPAWMSIVFAVGVFGGLAGCVLLLLRRAVAMPVFAVSLAGYAALFAGDIGYGVFDGNPSQLVILVFVVAVAAGLLAVTRFARGRGFLA